MKPTKQMMAEQYAKLDDWLARMEPSISYFIESVPAENRGKLDYSVESLDFVEANVLEGFSTMKSHAKPEAPLDGQRLMTAAHYYAHAVYKRYLPEARWDVNLVDTRFGSLGAIDLYGPDDNPYQISPPTYEVFRHNRGTVMREKLVQRMEKIVREFRGKRRPARLVSERIRREWLSETDEALEYFLDWLPAEVSGRLDLSPESLDVLEKWLHTGSYESSEVFSGMCPEVSDGAAVYIGEVFRRRLGGRWDIPTSSPIAKSFERPVVRVREKPVMVVYPLEMIWNSLLNPKRTQWKKEFERVAGKVEMADRKRK